MTLEDRYTELLAAFANYEEAIHNHIKEGEAELASYKEPLKRRVLSAITALASVRDIAEEITESTKVGA